MYVYTCNTNLYTYLPTYLPTYLYATYLPTFLILCVLVCVFCGCECLSLSISLCLCPCFDFSVSVSVCLPQLSVNSVTFLYFSKTFDTVAHAILLYKLSISLWGVTENSLQLFKSYLTNSQQRCYVNDELSFT